MSGVVDEKEPVLRRRRWRRAGLESQQVGINYIDGMDVSWGVALQATIA